MLIWSFFISIQYFSCVQVNLSFRVGNTACFKPARLVPNLKMVFTNALGWLNERVTGYLYFLFIFFPVLWFIFYGWKGWAPLRIINISVWFLLHMVESIAFADFIIWKFCGRIAPWNMDPGLWCVSGALLFVYNYLMMVRFSSILLFPLHWDNEYNFIPSSLSVTKVMLIVFICFC